MYEDRSRRYVDRSRRYEDRSRRKDLEEGEERREK